MDRGKIEYLSTHPWIDIVWIGERTTAAAYLTNQQPPSNVRIMLHYYPPGHPFHQPTPARADSNRSSTASWRSGPSRGGNSSDSSVGTLSSCGTLFSDSGNSQDRNWKNGFGHLSLSALITRSEESEEAGLPPAPTQAPAPGEVVEAGSTPVQAQGSAQEKKNIPHWRK